MSDVRAGEILRRRAEELARPLDEVGVLEVGTHLVLPAGGERLAVRLDLVERVFPLGRRWARLPGAPPHVAGVANVKGRLVPLTDLLPILGLAPQQLSRETYGVVVTASGPDVIVSRTALVCSARPSEISIDSESLDEPPDVLSAPVLQFISGIAQGLITVIDVERLLADPVIVAGPSGEERTRGEPGSKL